MAPVSHACPHRSFHDLAIPMRRCTIHSPWTEGFLSRPGEWIGQPRVAECLEREMGRCLNVRRLGNGFAMTASILPWLADQAIVECAGSSAPSAGVDSPVSSHPCGGFLVFSIGPAVQSLAPGAGSAPSEGASIQEHLVRIMKAARGRRISGQAALL
jgi:hypothetical protein